jgi:predicted Zn finger-like uncharacterized protein
MQNSVILPDSWLKLFLDFSFHSLFIASTPTEKIEGIFMRIVCPNCASQYEVAPDAIPEAGRDVQCAKCAEIWFQNRPMQLTMEEAPLPLETAPAVEPSPEPESASEPTVETDPEAEPSPAAKAEAVAETSAVFRSLRSERETVVETAPVVEATPEPELKQRQSLSPEIQDILQQEAAFSADQLNRATEPTTEPVAQPTPIIDEDALENDATQPDVAELTRQLRALEEQRDQLVRKQAETDPNESVTLASAKSLRDILESEAIDPVDITDAEPAPAMPEPSLEKLGLKRPTPIIQSEDVAENIQPMPPVVEPASAPEEIVAPAIDTEPKTGKAIFADIDELNPNNADDETDVADDDLIEFQDEEIVEKASKFSIGFLVACGLVILATTLYFFAPKIAGSVPALSGPMTSYHTGIDHQRMVLQDMYYQGGEPGFGTLLNNAKAKFLE